MSFLPSADPVPGAAGWCDACSNNSSTLQMLSSSCTKKRVFHVMACIWLLILTIIMKCVRRSYPINFYLASVSPTRLFQQLLILYKTQTMRHKWRESTTSASCCLIHLVWPSIMVQIQMDRQLKIPHHLIRVLEEGSKGKTWHEYLSINDDAA